MSGVPGITSPVQECGAAGQVSQKLAFTLLSAFEGGRRFHPANSREQEEEAAGS